MQRKQEKRTTIDVVSRHAGVSKTTISRYLNGKYEFMSEETRSRIQASIQELHYQPNAMARSLKNNKTGLIGLIVGDITHPFSSILVKAVGDTCEKHGYQVLMANTDDDAKKEREYITSMLNRQVEGLIINTAGGNERFLAELKDHGILMCLADRRLPDNILDTVTTDTERVTTEMLELVYQAGFEQVAFFTNSLHNNSARQRRYETFRQVTQRHCQTLEKPLYLIGDKSGEQSCFDALETLMASSGGKKTAVLTVNGVVLLDLLNAAKAHGYSIPRDFGLCSYDGWSWAGIIGDGISVITHPSYEIGKQSAELIIARINSEDRDYPPRYLEIPSTIEIRGSTRCDK